MTKPWAEAAMCNTDGKNASDHNENGEASYSRVVDDKGDGGNVEPCDDEAVAFE